MRQLLHYGETREDATLAIYRTEFLFRNQDFVGEYIKSMRIKQRLGGSSPEYKKSAEELFRRWAFSAERGVSCTRRKIVEFRGADRFTGTVDLRIDVRYRKARIMKALERVIYKFHDEFAGLTDEIRQALSSRGGVNRAYEKDFQRIWLNAVVPEKRGYKPTDTNDYENYLRVWELRTKGMSWSRIVREWNGSNGNRTIDVQLARNWFKRAEILIREGIPGFPPFPPSK